ncbi:MAG: hypothetical protein Q8R37_04760 [Nanoarchaeota archaeon]|nr:hypothetical protein [Nanoarchaeota archaeon]
MNWLNRFLQLFKKKKIIEIVPIPIAHLIPWIQNQSQEIRTTSRLDNTLADYKQKLHQRRWIVEYYLDQWEEKNVDEKIQLFLSKTRQIVEKISFPEKDDIEAILTANSLRKEEIEILIEEIEQSPFAHQFQNLIDSQKGQEKNSVAVNPLLKELVELNGIMINLEQKASRSGLRTIKSLILKERELQQSVVQLKELQQKVERQRDKLHLAEKMKQEKEVELSLLQQHPHYQEVQKKQEKKAIITQKIKERKDKVTMIFNQLNPLLQQYQQLHPENTTITAYLTDANEAVVADEGLQINHILKHCRAALDSKRFTIPEDHKNIIIKTLEKVDAQFCTKVQQHCIHFQKELQELESALEDRHFIAKIEDVQYRQNHFSTLAEEVQEKISSLESEIEEIEDKQFADKSLFENMVRMTFGKGIEIIL